ncbi:probable low-specificity L-threonine aldolase 2 [Aplysia californica]|uniref:Probable low-specificity L-threonine aldolase 2 n=1 Tax=Aplysia californica TaxID=6500 RepID=A0ABM1VVG2_APLCA|nr:probable low-specificity L-threonine aldolase 2 [Aplysia californica]
MRSLSLLTCARNLVSNNLLRNELKGKTLTLARIHHRGLATSSVSIVDLRSDTLTKPTPKMREAMKNAVVGDDCYGEDPTVNKLQDVCASMLGKEASLFVPTCTMANITAVIVHASGGFSEILLGEDSHMFLYEVAGMARFAGVQGRCVSTLPNGTLDLAELEGKIRPLDDVHQPWTKLICLENTHNKCGGRVVSLDYIQKVKEIARKNNLSFHLDGARLFNASTALKVPVSEVAQHFDTVSIAFSKGLCCPSGSILAGSKEFIAMARRARKALGGGMRQAGVVAAPMLVALEEMVDLLADDHDRAARIAQGLTAMGDNPVCSIAMDGVQSNIVMIDMKGKVSSEQFAQRMEQVSDREKTALGEAVSVRMLPFTATTVRYVTHHDVSDEDVDKAVRKIQYVIEELSSQ